MKFQLSEEERRQFQEWDMKHIRDWHNGKNPDTTAIGGRITFEITHTSISYVLKVRCSCKKDTCDLTDYDSW